MHIRYGKWSIFLLLGIVAITANCKGKKKSTGLLLGAAALVESEKNNQNNPDNEQTLYTISGRVSGLGGVGLVIQNNSGDRL